MGGKKKAGGGKGEAEDDKASQIVALQNKLEDVENKLAAERVVVEQLRAINADQSKQLVQSEALVKSETEKHSAEMWLLYDETTTAKEQASHENQVLVAKVKSLEADVEGLRVLEDENQRLRDRVGSLMSEVDKASRDHANETHRLKKEVFNLRMQLEQTFRKAMQELDAEYKQRALSNLDNESKNALAANAKLQAELQMQTEGIEALMSKYKAMEKEYTKLKIEHDVVQKGAALQETRIGGLRRANLVAASQLEELQLGAVGAGKQKIKELTEQLEQERQLREEAQAEAEKWKHRHETLERKTATTIKRMRETQRKKERMLREKRTGMAAGSRAASVSGSVKQQDSGSLPPHPLEGYGFPQIGAQQSVEAFDAYTDILAIWNSNFPTPQTNGGRVGGNTAPNRRPQRSRSQATVGRSRTAALMKGMEPGMRRDVSLPASLLPRDARQLAKSLRSPSPIVRDESGQLPPPRVPASRSSSTFDAVPQKDVGNLDAGLGDLLRRSKKFADAAAGGRTDSRGSMGSARSGNGGGTSSRRSSGSGKRYFAP